MKLDPGVTVYHGGKKYKNEIPDDIAEKANIKPKNEHKPERASGSGSSDKSRK